MENNTLGQKVLLILYAGVALGFTYSPSRQRKILTAAEKEWRKINKENLKKRLEIFIDQN
ncbi:MAG: hypothetical protein A2896_02525 [Candidatus Nealsonbacteria bacterium RIFCSPLOWO2_01_FULL_43_32]|uniref:Uncharacterized protein n=1 Tax=Candidatus Nealsonbacteria bacterium RIFCSPLOWO2_01_FULL_43_32 TaxID=1801672 RepID=A0A1G2EH85_9BACT|nr:MAG: hypothetical protein A2896_02525 [Candidatus Nealsonbacteria bacterium RIFCSPLOWO2_01_FULL_43_32]